MLVLNLPFKALMFLTLMMPSLVLFLVLCLKLVKDFLNVPLSLHDALPISRALAKTIDELRLAGVSSVPDPEPTTPRDRKSTRLNSSHGYISYAVLCLHKRRCACYR